MQIRITAVPNDPIDVDALVKVLIELEREQRKASKELQVRRPAPALDDSEEDGRD